MADKLLFTRKASAQALSISLRTLDNLIVSKEILVRRVGRKVLIPAGELDKFARRDHKGRTVTPTAANAPA
jgi:excisionase family DNA binding protein